MNARQSAPAPSREIAAADNEEVKGDYSPQAAGDYSPVERIQSPYSPPEEGVYSPSKDHSPLSMGGDSPQVASDYSPEAESPGELIDLAEFKEKVTSHPSATFDDKKWKRSRVKPGHLITRVQGYDLVESEYGVNYLKVLRRRPKRTSGDYSLHEHAGFFTWHALQAGGRLARERKRNERVNIDRTNAS